MKLANDATQEDPELLAKVRRVAVRAMLDLEREGLGPTSMLNLATYLVINWAALDSNADILDGILAQLTGNVRASLRRIKARAAEPAH